MGSYSQGQQWPVSVKITGGRRWADVKNAGQNVKNAEADVKDAGADVKGAFGSVQLRWRRKQWVDSLLTAVKDTRDRREGRWDRC